MPMPAPWILVLVEAKGVWRNDEVVGNRWAALPIGVFDLGDRCRCGERRCGEPGGEWGFIGAVVVDPSIVRGSMEVDRQSLILFELRRCFDFDFVFDFVAGCFKKCKDDVFVLKVISCFHCVVLLSMFGVEGSFCWTNCWTWMALHWWASANLFYQIELFCLNNLRIDKSWANQIYIPLLC